MSSLFFIHQLVEEIENNWPTVLAKLEEIRRILLNRNAMLCNVTLDQANWKAFQPKLNRLLDALPAAPVNTVEWFPQQLPDFEGFSIPAGVNYVAKGANLYTLGYRLHGSTLVTINHLLTNWLWNTIRLQGGAYDGTCDFNPRSGFFSYVSYHDPHLLKTLDNYDQAAQFLLQTDVGEDELTRCIIGVIGQLDMYQLPDFKGYTSMTLYLTGLTDELRQRIRDEVFSTTHKDMKAFAEILEQVRDTGHVVVMGSQEAIERANTERGGWLETRKVL